jgi:hypothetical protein
MPRNYPESSGMITQIFATGRGCGAGGGGQNQIELTNILRQVTPFGLGSRLVKIDEAPLTTFRMHPVKSSRYSRRPNFFVDLKLSQNGAVASGLPA